MGTGVDGADDPARADAPEDGGDAVDLAMAAPVDGPAESHALAGSSDGGADPLAAHVDGTAESHALVGSSDGGADSLGAPPPLRRTRRSLLSAATSAGLVPKAPNAVALFVQSKSLKMMHLTPSARWAAACAAWRKASESEKAPFVERSKELKEIQVEALKQRGIACKRQDSVADDEPARAPAATTTRHVRYGDFVVDRLLALPLRQTLQTSLDFRASCIQVLRQCLAEASLCILAAKPSSGRAYRSRYTTKLCHMRLTHIASNSTQSMTTLCTHVLCKPRRAYTVCLHRRAMTADETQRVKSLQTQPHVDFTSCCSNVTKTP